MPAAMNPDPLKGDTSPDCLLGTSKDVAGTRRGDSSHIEPEATLQRSPDQSLGSRNDQSCLVQIYPADVVDGMLLIEKDELMIGREAGSDLMLSDTSVSRQHAIIRRTEAGFELEDLGSTNGTFVGGRQVTRARLNSGDTIRFGSFLF